MSVPNNLLGSRKKHDKQNLYMIRTHEGDHMQYGEEIWGKTGYCSQNIEMKKYTLNAIK